MVFHWGSTALSFFSLFWGGGEGGICFLLSSGSSGKTCLLWSIRTLWSTTMLPEGRGTLCKHSLILVWKTMPVHYSISSSYQYFLLVTVPAGSPSRGGDVVVYVKDINQQSLPTPFHSVLVSVSVFMALPTVFHSINSPDNSLLSHSVLPVLFLPYWSFQLCISLWRSPSALI